MYKIDVRGKPETDHLRTLPLTNLQKVPYAVTPAQAGVWPSKQFAATLGLSQPV